MPSRSPATLGCLGGWRRCSRDDGRPKGAHIAEIGVWAAYYGVAGINIRGAGVFDFAFENYTALGYGDAVAAEGRRLVGPITALNGLLLIGWSVAVIFEVMRFAELQIGGMDKDES